MTVTTYSLDISDNISTRNSARSGLKKICSVKTVKNKVPILKWLPKYTFGILIQDLIAGITVGLTAIPQGIAYAVVAGLSPEYGLYSGLMGGFVYLIFGSCKDVTIGPTAIMAAMVAKYVNGFSTDFAVLAAFLAGTIELLMGILKLGFLVEFISTPVISGFTTAASLQIASAQLKSLFGLNGPSGNTLAESVYYFFKNIQTAKLWDPILGFTTIAILFALKYVGEGCKRTDGTAKKMRWFISLARNAIVVILGMIIAYLLKVATDSEPLKLIGDIGKGFPKPSLPPFSTVAHNETYTFVEMVEVLGTQSIMLPMVAILESVAIAKAFSGGGQIDASQEMIALGMCNIVGSCFKSMPITGSFTRTALNHASGVQTPAGGIFTGVLILLALGLLTSTFHYIPKASLAGLIITAMYYMVDYNIFYKLWCNSKIEFMVLIITVGICSTLGIEYGIVIGIAIDALLLLYSTSRPSVKVTIVKNETGEIIFVSLPESVPFSAAEHVRRKILKVINFGDRTAVIAIDGQHVKKINSTVASNLMSSAKDVCKTRQIWFLNFNDNVKHMCLSIKPEFVDKFVRSSNNEEFIKLLSKNQDMFYETNFISNK